MGLDIIDCYFTTSKPAVSVTLEPAPPAGMVMVTVPAPASVGVIESVLVESVNVATPSLV